MKKLCLIYPNQRWQKDDVNTVWDLNPVTLTLLASMVKDIIDVEILDAQFYNLTIEEFRSRIKEINPDIVGVSLMTSEYKDILDICINEIKEINNKIITIAGGVHITTNYKLAMKNKNIDYGVLGEGENTLRNLILHLYYNHSLPEKGLVYWDNNCLVVQNHALVEDLTKLPWPSYEFVDMEAYLAADKRKGGPNVPPALPAFRTTVTRGCSFGCTFCQVELISGKKTRCRNPEDIVNEFLFLKEKFGIKSIIFEDDNMLMAKGGRFAKELFQTMIDKKLDLPWIGTAFALFLLNDEILDLMKKSGCVGINVAIESGSQRVLKQIVKKPIKDINEVPNIINKIKIRGMHCFANYIIGYPGETWEEIRETFRFAEISGADYSKFFVAVPLIGTEMYDMAKTMGLLNCNDEYHEIDWRFASISSDEWTANDITVLRAYEWDRINFTPKNIENLSKIWRISKDEINVIRKRTRDSIVFQKN